MWARWRIKVWIDNVTAVNMVPVDQNVSGIGGHDYEDIHIRFMALSSMFATRASLLPISFDN